MYLNFRIPLREAYLISSLASSTQNSAIPKANLYHPFNRSFLISQEPKRSDKRPCAFLETHIHAVYLTLLHMLSNWECGKNY